MIVFFTTTNLHASLFLYVSFYSFVWGLGVSEFSYMEELCIVLNLFCIFFFSTREVLQDILEEINSHNSTLCTWVPPFSIKKITYRKRYMIEISGHICLKLLWWLMACWTNFCSAWMLQISPAILTSKYYLVQLIWVLYADELWIVSKLGISLHCGFGCRIKIMVLQSYNDWNGRAIHECFLFYT